MGWLSVLPCFLWAQSDPEGELDYFYVVCGDQGYVGAGQNELCFQLRFHSDNLGIFNRIVAFSAPIIITGNNIVSVDITLEKAYQGSDLEPGNWGIRTVTKEGDLDPTVPPFWMIYGAVSFETTLTGDGRFVNICLTINDTGTICLDTHSTQIVNPQFVMASANTFTPGWGGPAGQGYPDGQGVCCQVYFCSSMPGDADASGTLTLVDIVRLIYHIFGLPLCSGDLSCLSGQLCRGDWNGNGDLNLADIIWGVNYVFDRDRYGTNCLGSSPGNCWPPVSTDVCCLPLP